MTLMYVFVHQTRRKQSHQNFREAFTVNQLKKRKEFSPELIFSLRNENKSCDQVETLVT